MLEHLVRRETTCLLGAGHFLTIYLTFHAFTAITVYCAYVKVSVRKILFKKRYIYTYIKVMSLPHRNSITNI